MIQIVALGCKPQPMRPVDEVDPLTLKAESTAWHDLKLRFRKRCEMKAGRWAWTAAWEIGQHLNFGPLWQEVCVVAKERQTTRFRHSRAVASTVAHESRRSLTVMYVSHCTQGGPKLSLSLADLAVHQLLSSDLHLLG